RPIAAILAERHLLRHPVDLLLALPEIERPGIFEGLVLLAGLKEGHQSDSNRRLSFPPSPLWGGLGWGCAPRGARGALPRTPLSNLSPTRGERLSGAAAAITVRTPSRFSSTSLFQKRSTR